MPERSPRVSPEVSPNHHIDVSYGYVHSTHNKLTPHITTKKGFFPQDHGGVDFVDNSPTMIVKRGPSVIAVPTSSGVHELQIEEPYSSDSGMHFPNNGRVLVVTPQKRGIYTVELAQNEMEVNFSQGTMVILLDERGINTEKVDALLAKGDAHLASTHTNAEGVLKDMLNVLNKNKALQKNVDPHVTTFALMADAPKSLEPLSRFSQLIGIKKFVNASWKAAEKVETAATGEEHDVKPLVITSESVANFMDQAQKEVVDNTAAGNLAYLVQMEYVSIDNNRHSAGPKPFRHHGRTTEEIPNLGDFVLPEKVKELYETGKLVTLTSPEEDGDHTYEVDIIRFLSANLLFQQAIDKPHGVINIQPEKIDGVDFNSEEGQIQVFPISQEHALRNVRNTASALGINDATLRQIIKLIVEQPLKILDDPLEMRNYPVMKELLSPETSPIDSI